MAIGVDVRSSEGRDASVESARALHYQALVAAMPDLLFRIDKKLRFLDFSAGDPTQLAMPPELFVGKTIPEVFGGPQGDGRGFADRVSLSCQFSQAVGRTFETGEVQRLEYAFRKQWFEARIVRAGPDEVLAIARDVTHDRQLKEALKSSEERLSLAIAVSGQGLWDWNVVTGETYVSPGCWELTGYAEGEFRPDPAFFMSIVHPDDLPAIESSFREYLQGKGPEVFGEYRMRRKSGEYVWIRSIGRVTARDDHGAPLRMIGVMIDISRDKQAEQALMAAIQARDNLLAVVSHDLRSPLSSIQLSAQALGRSQLAGDAQANRRQVDIILRSAQSMHRLIDDLLQASTIEAGTFAVELGREEVSAIIENAYLGSEPAATAKSVRLRREVQEGIRPLCCDRLRLTQVLANLLDNAIKFSPAGGSVVLRAWEQAGDVHFAVGDDGPGIAADEVAHLFDRYWKGKTEGRRGIGLGLYIAKGIVEAHGGRIWAETQLGGGSTFVFALPISQPAAPSIR